MFNQQQFIASVYDLKDLPKLRLPELVLCGRSNVGKSSFINSLFNNKNLAKTSSTPGKTRSINYYKIDESFYVVDLPGYGYAKTSLTERKKWAKLIDNFFRQSGNISLVVHLIDSRHHPTVLDVQLNELITSLSLPYIVLLNKSDKLKQSELSGSFKNTKQYFQSLVLYNNAFFYSAVKGNGKKEIKKLLASLFY